MYNFCFPRRQFLKSFHCCLLIRLSKALTFTAFLVLTFVLLFGTLLIDIIIRAVSGEITVGFTVSGWQNVVLIGTVTGRRDFNIYVAEPDRGSVAWFGIVKENDIPLTVAPESLETPGGGADPDHPKTVN